MCFYSTLTKTPKNVPIFKTKMEEARGGVRTWKTEEKNHTFFFGEIERKKNPKRGMKNLIEVLTTHILITYFTVD